MAASVRRITVVLAVLASLAAGGVLETAAMPQQPRYGVEPVGQIGGPLNALALDGDYAYIGVGPRLEIVSLADPARPTRVWQSPDYGQLVRNVAVADSIAYVALGDDGVRVLDVANPAAPSEIATSPGQSEELAVAGPLLINVNRRAFAIYDRRDPANLRQLGTTGLPGRIAGLNVHGSQVYLSSGEGLLVVDIGDPTRPTLRDDPLLPDNVRRLVTSGDRAYVTYRERGLSNPRPIPPRVVVFDLSNPASPTQIAAFDVENDPGDLAIIDGLLYVATSRGGLRVLDVSDPQAPVEVGNLPDAAGLLAVNAARKLVGVWLQPGLHLLSTADPAQPALVSSYTPPVAGLVVGVTIVGERAYAVTQNGMWILDLSDPPRPRPIGTIPLEGAERVVVREPYAYVIAKGRGVRIVDVRDPANPQQIGRYAMRGDINLGMAIAGSHAYIVGLMVGMRSVDIAVPSQPLEITPPRDMNADFLDHRDSGGYHGVVVAGPYAYVYNGAGQLQIMDVGEPARPRQVGTYELSRGGRDYTTALGLAIVDGYAYVLTASDEFIVLSLADPVAPRQVALMPVPDFSSAFAPGEFEDLTVVGPRAYLAAEGGLRVVDISDPMRPREVASNPTPSFQTSALGDYVYTASIQHGLQILRLQNAASPAPPPPGQPAR